MLDGSSQRWFGPGFLDRETATTSALLAHLVQTDRAGYAAACEALAAFDVRDRLAQITTPVLAIAGADDSVIPVADLAFIARTVRNGRLAVMEGVAHLAPAESPAQTAMLITEHIDEEKL